MSKTIRGSAHFRIFAPGCQVVTLRLCRLLSVFAWNKTIFYFSFISRCASRCRHALNGELCRPSVVSKSTSTSTLTGAVLTQISWLDTSSISRTISIWSLWQWEKRLATWQLELTMHCLQSVLILVTWPRKDKRSPLSSHSVHTVKLCTNCTLTTWHLLTYIFKVIVLWMNEWSLYREMRAEKTTKFRFVYRAYNKGHAQGQQPACSRPRSVTPEDKAKAMLVPINLLYTVVFFLKKTSFCNMFLENSFSC